jgi:hypothetical protein
MQRALPVEDACSDVGELFASGVSCKVLGDYRSEEGEYLHHVLNTKRSIQRNGFTYFRLLNGTFVQNQVRDCAEHMLVEVELHVGLLLELFCVSCLSRAQGDLLAIVSLRSNCVICLSRLSISRGST